MDGPGGEGGASGCARLTCSVFWRSLDVNRSRHLGGDAGKQQTSKELDKKAMTVPDISEVGTYEVTVKLHPEVTGKFNLEVQKA